MCKPWSNTATHMWKQNHGVQPNETENIVNGFILSCLKYKIQLALQLHSSRDKLTNIPIGEISRTPRRIFLLVSHI